MTWTDQHGINHDGRPPEGRQQLGGRWYPMDDHTNALEPDRPPRRVLVEAA